MLGTETMDRQNRYFSTPSSVKPEIDAAYQSRQFRKCPVGKFKVFDFKPFLVLLEFPAFRINAFQAIERNCCKWTASFIYGFTDAILITLNLKLRPKCDVELKNNLHNCRRK